MTFENFLKKVKFSKARLQWFYNKVVFTKNKIYIITNIIKRMFLQIPLCPFLHDHFLTTMLMKRLSTLCRNVHVDSGSVSDHVAVPHIQPTSKLCTLSWWLNQHFFYFFTEYKKSPQYAGSFLQSWLWTKFILISLTCVTLRLASMVRG